MPMHDLVAVAEHFGDDWRGHIADEFPQRGVAGAEQVDAQPAKPIHEGVGGDVLAGPVSRE